MILGRKVLKNQQVGFTCLKNETLTISKYENKFWMMCDRHKVALPIDRDRREP